jgi:hypothetical protein
MANILSTEEKIAENEKSAKSFITEVVIPAFEQFVKEVNDKKKSLHAELRSSDHVAHVVINEGSEDFFDFTVKADYDEYRTTVATYERLKVRRGIVNSDGTLASSLKIQKKFSECIDKDLYKGIWGLATQFLDRNYFYRD